MVYLQIFKNSRKKNELNLGKIKTKLDYEIKSQLTKQNSRDQSSFSGNWFFTLLILFGATYNIILSFYICSVYLLTFKNSKISWKYLQENYLVYISESSQLTPLHPFQKGRKEPQKIINHELPECYPISWQTILLTLMTSPWQRQGCHSVITRIRVIRAARHSELFAR